MAKQNHRKGGGARKYGRKKRKLVNKSKALSQYVRNKISFEKYLSLTSKNK